MKKAKLTLIELLISMAIFTIMITLLIKAFQLSSDLSSKQESKTQKLEQSQLILSLLSTELKKAIVREGKTWVRTNQDDYSSLNKSLNFFIDTTDGQESIRFFYPNTDYRKINVIEYKVVAGDLKRFEKEFVQYTDPGWANYNAGTLNFSTVTDSMKVLGHSGLDNSNSIVYPPELESATQQTYPAQYQRDAINLTYTSETLIKSDELADIEISYFVNNEKESDGSLTTNPALAEGQKPDLITLKLTFGTDSKSLSFSRSISLNGR